MKKLLLPVGLVCVLVLNACKNDTTPANGSVTNPSTTNSVTPPSTNVNTGASKKGRFKLVLPFQDGSDMNQITSELGFWLWDSGTDSFLAIDESNVESLRTAIKSFRQQHLKNANDPTTFSKDVEWVEITYAETNKLKPCNSDCFSGLCSDLEVSKTSKYCAQSTAETSFEAKIVSIRNFDKVE